MTEPVFIFSLPRSGSTLLQNLLAVHPEITSVAEPWLLLHLASMEKNENIRIYSNYSSLHAQNALRDFVSHLPESRPGFLKAINNFVRELYGSIDHRTRYYLDKTPRYYLIIDFIAQVFPEAKFIFLCRHPLDVLSSIVTTWAGNRLFLTHWAVDIYKGPFFLFEGYRKYKERSFLVYYEQLVNKPQETLEGVCEFLQLPYSSTLMTDFLNVDISGKMGDQGIKSKGGIDNSSIERWERVLNTKVRRKFAKRYIEYLGPELLSFFNINEQKLSARLKIMHCSWAKTGQDTLGLLIATFGRFFVVKILKEQWKRGPWTSDMLS